MNRFKKPLMVAGLSALLAGTALAASGTTTIKNLPDEGQVSISGTVASVENAREFTLRDETGTIGVDITSNQSVVLKKGDKVTVNGVIDSGITGTDINASNVTVHKDMSEAMGDVIEGNTAISFEGATTYKISQLPKEGLVKVSGTVSKVSSEEKFTLRDDTGNITVDMDSAAESAALTQGATVTVIGYVDSGILGKDINAKKVLVVENAKPVARVNH